MDDQPTCGKGLAAHSALPALMGELTGAVAEILELHLVSLDPKDSPSRPEHEAYTRLVREHRDAAERLRAIGGSMAGHRDLPMANHHMQALTDPRNVGAFERFVTLERELRELLEARLATDEEMLAGMRG